MPCRPGWLRERRGLTQATDTGCVIPRRRRGYAGRVNPVAWMSAAWSGGRWATGQLRHLRQTLGPDGLNAQLTAGPPTLERGSLRGARIGLRMRGASCLERSLVVQGWYASRGLPMDVVIGVRSPTATTGDMAHAWVEGWDDDTAGDYVEIRRVAAPQL